MEFEPTEYKYILSRNDSEILGIFFQHSIFQACNNKSDVEPGNTSYVYTLMLMLIEPDNSGFATS